MQTFIACSTFALAVTLAVRRPRLGARFEITPATAAVAGVLLLLATGTVALRDVAAALAALWRPLLTIFAIMVATAAARQAGAVQAAVDAVLARGTVPIGRLFRRVFLLSLVVSSLLSNDAAVLLVTPLVLAFVGHRYPTQPALLGPFAFAVFMAAGVAPFVTSNPMNMVVASYVGLNFNAYAGVMLPIAVLGSCLTLFILERVFARDLAAAPSSAVESCGAAREGDRAKLRGPQIRMMLLLGTVTATYPLVAMFDGAAIWVVSVVGAMLAIGLVWRDGLGHPVRVLRSGVAWDVLIFVPASFVLSMGLRNVGLVDVLVDWYRNAGLVTIGLTAALGSAVLNNHPMALVNMLALDARPATGLPEFLAALIGGDLGPRLLPIGSLAGLLWLECCRRLGVAISPGRFIAIGAVLTIPTLLLSLLLLTALT